MTFQKKGLGRGLSALIPDAEMNALSDVTRENNLFAPPSTTPTGAAGGSSGRPARDKTRIASPASTSTNTETARDGHGSTKKTSAKPEMLDATSTLNIRLITPNPFQPRRTFDDEELQDLAASIRLHGILQPVLVRPIDGATGTFQLVAGERRWRAAQLAGLENIPVIVRPMADQQALELALIENVQRHDISAIDAALAYERLANEFSLSQEQISRRVGKSRSAVANTVRLLALPEEARKAIEEGVLTEGHGRAILLASGEGARRAIFRRVVRDKLSVREAERLARSASAGNEEDETKDMSPKPSLPGEWAEAERIITKKLGARAKVRTRGHRGSIHIECSSSGEVERVLALLQKLP